MRCWRCFNILVVPERPMEAGAIRAGTAETVTHAAMHDASVACPRCGAQYQIIIELKEQS